MRPLRTISFFEGGNGTNGAVAIKGLPASVQITLFGTHPPALWSCFQYHR